MKIKNVKRTASLKDSKDIMKIGAWLDVNGNFESYPLLKFAWYGLAIECTVIQLSLFGICYKKVLWKQIELADKENFVEWGKEVVCSIPTNCLHLVLTASVLCL